MRRFSASAAVKPRSEKMPVLPLDFCRVRSHFLPTPVFFQQRFKHSSNSPRSVNPRLAASGGTRNVPTTPRRLRCASSRRPTRLPAGDRRQFPRPERSLVAHRRPDPLGVRAFAWADGFRANSGAPRTKCAHAGCARVAEFLRYSGRNQDAPVKQRQQVLTLNHHQVSERSSIGDDDQALHRLRGSWSMSSPRCVSNGEVIAPSRRKSSTVYSNHTPRFFRNPSNS